ncbi:MAG TPA: DUF6690 family protein [Pirellulaceae bacterium]|nr:DUF6690 family protein [Pirellulaceae bacterium]
MENTKKKWLFIPFLLTALGVPYAVFDGGVGKLLGQFNGGTAQPFDPLAPVDSYTPASSWPNGAVPNGALARPTEQRLEGPTVNDFREVIRFDISPRWVAEHWSRVSTVTAELEMEGLRVPLVTGPKPDDLAGSLTYYFDRQHTLQRLTFHGTTGDERRLVLLLGSVYGFQEQPTVGGTMFLTTWNGKPTSMLRVAHAPVVRATTPNSQREVMLEINRPSEYTALSPEMRGILERDAHIKRW